MLVSAQWANQCGSFFFLKTVGDYHPINIKMNSGKE
jgi:hypothetical protein